MTYLEQIKSLRLGNGYTQAEMAERLHCHKRDYSRLERGLARMTVDQLEAIAAILDVTPDELFRG